MVVLIIFMCLGSVRLGRNLWRKIFSTSGSYLLGAGSFSLQLLTSWRSAFSSVLMIATHEFGEVGGR